MKMILKNSLFAIIASTLVLVGCKKDFDSPPITVLPQGNIITIDSLRKIYTSFDSTIVNDLSVFGTVTADEISGNLYKTIYIQDETAGILLKLTTSSSKTFFEGDKVRVSLKGTLISNYKSMIQLGNVNPDVNLIKQGIGTSIAPKVVTIADLDFKVNGYSRYQGQLIQLNNVEFACSDICGLYGYPLPTNQSGLDRNLTDTLGGNIIVRTSGYASFAGVPLQQGKGSFVAIVSQYYTTIQLTIRKLEDVNLTGTRKTTCAPCPITLHAKDFSDESVTSGGWSTYNVTGTLNWYTDDFPSGDPYGVITNTSAKLTGETWYISPALNLTNTNTPSFNFRSATNTTGNSALQAYVLTNYNGGDPNSNGTLNLTSPTLSSGSWSWIAGNIDLIPYKQSNVRVAFKYTGLSSAQNTWELDNILVTDY